MRNWRRWSLVLGLGLVSFAVFGQDLVPLEQQEIFQLGLTDPSRDFLGQVFGSVGTVLHGTSGQLVSTLFKIFNLGVLAVAGVFLVWATSASIIHTGHEGSFMGRQSKPAFNILRTVGGIGLLAPSVGGYSILQVIVMWVVIQGAGFANTAWNAALDYLQEGGTVFTPPSSTIAVDVDIVGTIFMSQVCMYNQEKQEKDLQEVAKQQIKEGNSNPTYERQAEFFPSFRPYVDATAKEIRFPSSRGNKKRDAGCGRWSWDQAEPANELYLRQALITVISDLDSVAKRIAYKYSYDSDSRRTEDTKAAIVGAAADWGNILLPLRSTSPKGNDLTGFFKDARDDGWIFAGSYYYKLTKLQRDFSKTMSIAVNKDDIPCWVAAKQEYNIVFSKSMESVITKNCESKLRSDYLWAANRVYLAKDLADEVSQAHEENVASVKNPGAGILAFFLSPLLFAINQIMAAIVAAGGDPILKLQAMGQAGMAVALIIWVLTTLIVFGLSLGLSVFSSINSAGYAFRDAVAVFLPPLMAMVGVMFVQGAMVAVFVPLIPFIIFTFAVLGWFIQVIEAMVAAPLVALGLTHPEGHDLLGKSEQAVMLLLGVFIRPVLMIIGLFAGMKLSNVLLNFLNIGFITVVSDAFSIFGFLATYSIYVGLVVTLVRQCYGLIYIIPDRVMRWIGMGIESTTMPEQALQAGEKAQGEVAGAMSSGMQKMTAESGRGADVGAKLKADMAAKGPGQGGAQ